MTNPRTLAAGAVALVAAGIAAVALAPPSMLTPISSVAPSSASAPAPLPPRDPCRLRPRSAGCRRDAGP